MDTPQMRCPKWESCNAPACPLSRDEGLNVPTLKGERVCLWLREGMKPGGLDRMPADISHVVKKVLPLILVEGGAYLRSKLNTAAKSGSKRTRFASNTAKA